MPQLVAALVLGVAGVAKLRSPHGAAAAIRQPAELVRAFAAGELGLAAVAVLTASWWSSILMAVLYAGFALLTLRLARAGAACGCFGARPDPASPGQSALSATLGGLALAGALGGAHDAGWILERPAWAAAVLILGAGTAVYGIVLAYTELPELWRAWAPV